MNLELAGIAAPQSGPVRFGEIVASRSWMRREISTILPIPGVVAGSGGPRRRDDPAPGP